MWLGQGYSAAFTGLHTFSSSRDRIVSAANKTPGVVGGDACEQNRAFGVFGQVTVHLCRTEEMLEDGI